jgi:transcriptional regulator with XRE-family HTH domain
VETEREIIAKQVRALRAAKDLDRAQLARLARVRTCVVKRIECPRLTATGVGYGELHAVAAALGTNPVALRMGAPKENDTSVGARNLAAQIEERPSRGIIARVCRALRALAGRG